MPDETSETRNIARDSVTPLPSHVKDVLRRSGLREDCVLEMGCNRFEGNSGIRDSYYEEDEKAFTSVLN
jgi:hypothetical protein